MHVNSLGHSAPQLVEPVLHDVYGGQAMTHAGVILGPAACMSPERARGRPVDKRADIWAFGCVLYEMLAGRQACAGPSVVDALGSVVKSDPDWTRLPADVPAGIADTAAP